MSYNFIRSSDADQRAKPQARPRPTGSSHSNSDQQTADIIDAFTGGAGRSAKAQASPARLTPPRTVDDARDGQHQELALEQRGVRELRRRARQLHIHNRSKMNKDELIAAIRNALR